MKEVICFHKPDEINGYLSNWYPSEFTKDGILYTSMEQYMMHQKAVLFNDDENAQKILAASSTGKIKALGRAVRNYNEVVWGGLRQIIVYRGLLEKFTQNTDLRDKIWGIGLSMKDDRRFDMDAWQGKNLLGFALMCVRTALHGIPYQRSCSK